MPQRRQKRPARRRRQPRAHRQTAGRQPIRKLRQRRAQQRQRGRATHPHRPAPHFTRRRAVRARGAATAGLLPVRFAACSKLHVARRSRRSAALSRILADVQPYRRQQAIGGALKRCPERWPWHTPGLTPTAEPVRRVAATAVR
eukprot:363465-Chlamydomonas_euryale.AAC.2